MNMERILIVDDDITFGLMLKTWLSKKGFGTQTAASAAAARTALCGRRVLARAERYAVARRGRNRPLQWMSGQRIEVPVIVMTSYAEIPERRALHETRRPRLRRQARQSRRIAEKRSARRLMPRRPWAMSSR